jgi:hypothetical protein
MQNLFFKKYRGTVISFSGMFICAMLISPAASAQGTAARSSIAYQAPVKSVKMSMAEYQDRVEGVWVAQMAAAIMGFRFEHHTASVEWVDQLPKPMTSAPVDDDWYYEMAAIRAFEKYGIHMTVQQLGEQWKENSCGSWGSSEQTRLLLNKGIVPPETGSPRYNKLWFSIGPQFSADVYGALAPAQPNVAAKMAREYGHINGYAEGVDGAVFMAGMVSLGFSEKDPHTIVRKAAQLIHPSSPYRQCLDLVISMADQGKTSREIFDAVEDRWHIEYPATNNAVPNGGIVATSLWFGEGDFLKTVNLAYGAADFTDADCNAANAAAVIGAMKGMKAIPDYLVKSFGDRIKGTEMGRVKLTPAVDESISELAGRTAKLGVKIVQEHGARLSGDVLTVPVQAPVTQAPELFHLADLMQYWNKDWKLERAGFGGAGGGMRGIRGNTYLDGDVLATYPRDEIRGLFLDRTVTIQDQHSLSFDAGVDSGRAWALDVFINNKRVLTKIIEGQNSQRNWETIQVDLGPFKNQTVKIRLYQRVLIPGKEAGNAYWRNIVIK